MPPSSAPRPSRRRLSLPALLAAVVLLVGCGAGDDGGAGAAEKPELVVSAAASLKTAFTTHARRFEDATVRASYAGSDVLATQIRNGLRPDVFASANTTLPDALYVEGLVHRPVHFAANELVLAVPAGSRKVQRFDDVRTRGVRLAIGSGSVPVGSYTRRLLDQLPPSHRDQILANVRSEEPDVTGIVGKLTQNAVDAGFVYHTDVQAAPSKLTEIKLPPTVVPVVVYGVAIVKGARQPLAAKAFVYDLIAGAGRDALEAEGFGVWAATRPRARAGV